jgi:ABC-type multidrug transport system fused ATPase/permease subunit
MCPVTGIAYRATPALRSNISAVTFLVAAIALLHLLRLYFDSLGRRTHLARTMEIITQLRLAVHRQALRLGPSDLEGKNSARVIELFTRLVDKLRDAIWQWLTVLGRDPVRVVLLALLVFLSEPFLALLILVPMAGAWALAHYVRYQGETKRDTSLDEVAKDQRLLAEALTKTQLVKSYGMEAFEQQQFERALERYQAQTTSALQSGRGWRAVVHVVWTVTVALAVFLAGYRELTSRESIPFDAALLMAAALICMWYPLARLWDLFDSRADYRNIAAGIQSWLDTRPEVEQVVGAKFLQPLSRVCEFQNVSYAVNGRKLLDGVNLKLPAGKTIAFVGSDPLEARALAALMLRFIEPQSGRILFDGEEIAWVTLESLRAETVYVSGQEPYLTGTIRDNLSGGNNYATTDLTDACRTAHAHAFIEKFGQGYETVIGEHGEQLDPGQAFRLSLARAILRKPAVLIIEEPTAPIDDDVKLMLDDAYKKITPNRTVIFLANRLSTIRRCEEIVFLHKGRVVGVGEHTRLVQASPLYRHWEYTRFNEFRHEFESA